MEIHMPQRKENGKYSCNGCGIQVDFSELRCCETWGYFYCPSCQERHRCRITEDGVVEILPFDPFGQKNQRDTVALFEDTPTVHDVVFFDSKKKDSDSGKKQTVERVFCSKCGDVLVKSAAHLCPKCGKYFCDECINVHVCNQADVQKYHEKLERLHIQTRAEQERIRRIEQEKTNRERAKEPEKYSRCDNCGNYFSKHELKRCHTCGLILCSSCRENHTHSVLENLWKDRGKLKDAFRNLKK